MRSDNSNRILYTLKSRGALGTGTLAPALGITEVGVRQHLAKLHGEGLVAFDDQAGEVGRPKRMWRVWPERPSPVPGTPRGPPLPLLLGGPPAFFGGGGGWLLLAAPGAAAGNHTPTPPRP